MNILIAILLLSFVQVEKTDLAADRYLQQGYELEQQGQPKQALQLWQKAIRQLDIPSVAIATAYLRVATQYDFRDYFPAASLNYQWGMSGTDETAISANRQAMRKELLRLKPLLDEQQFSKWESMLAQNNPALFKEVREFWSRLNIRPASSYNERLIEHWKRIAYAREHYTKRSDSPYDTDARGLFYVKYGQADYKETGRVDVTQDKMKWILDQFISKGGNDNTPTNFDLMKLSNAISNLFLNPEYELWIYDSPDEGMDHNLVLIFGYRSGGSFGRLEVLEDFVPVTAFNSMPIIQGNPSVPVISPGLVLQLIYYEHFYSKDPYFAQLYSNLTNEAFRNGVGSAPDPSLAGTLRNRNINLTSRLIRETPDEFSTEENKIPDIPMDVYQYRMLDELNRPIFATFIESYPHNAFISDLVFNEEVMSATGDGTYNGKEHITDWYSLTHGLQLRDEEWEILGQASQNPPLVLDPYGESPGNSVMMIPWAGETINQVFYVELMNHHPESQHRVETLFPTQFRGLGKLEVEQPEPLVVEEGKLAASDLILGYGKLEEELEDDILFNFTPANNQQILEGENIVIHFEVYQLQLDQDGISRFEVEYGIRPESRFLGFNRPQKDQFRLTLRFEHDSNRFAESLEIETVGIEAGNYELEWTILDIQSGQTFEQQVQFEVVEMDVYSIAK